MQPGISRERQCAPRSARELIGLGDRHFEQFSDEEMTVLFQHLREQGMGDPACQEDLWRLLQDHLRRNGIIITVFPAEGKTQGCAIGLSNLIDRLWTQQVDGGGYCKMGWKVFRKQLWLRRLSA